jgi:ASC-1-like (ASCH) protein
MDHVAILKKSSVSKGDDLLGDIISGAKTIESRWYVNRIAPWDRIEKGDTVYFKESGFRVTARAKVSRIIQYENLGKSKIR